MLHKNILSLFLLLLVAVNLSAATVDVRNFGALPNDANDDSVAIQKAIDSAPNNSIIFFPSGVYLVADLRINNRSGLTLTGDNAILKRPGSYPNIIETNESTDLVISKLSFDLNGVEAYGGVLFYNAKRITISNNHFFDSNKKPVAGIDRYSVVFGRGSTPSEDILINGNLIEDLQLEVDFGLRVRIEGNTVIRPVATAGIGVFTIGDNTAAQQYVIQKNTIIDPVVSGGGITLHLDPPTQNNSTMKSFRILDNRINYTKDIIGNHASAIRLGTGNNSQATTGNIFDDIVIQGNIIYKDPRSPYDFGDIEAIIFGNSSTTANFKFDNMNISNNQIYYNRTQGIHMIDIREKGVNYVESNNQVFNAVTGIPSAPINLTVTK
jgi:hypothetical protein